MVKFIEGSAHLSIHIACAVANLEKHIIGKKGLVTERKPFVSKYKLFVVVFT